MVWFWGQDITCIVHWVYTMRILISPRCAMWGPQSHFSWLKCTLTHTTVWEDGSSVCQDFPALQENIWYCKWLPLLPRQHEWDREHRKREQDIQAVAYMSELWQSNVSGWTKLLINNFCHFDIKVRVVILANIWCRTLKGSGATYKSINTSHKQK